MLTIGICDDQAAARETLRYALDKELRGEAAYYEFSSGEGLTGWLEKHAGELDLLFLDVEMTGADGLETARLLRAQGHQFLLVFVTGYPDFVFDGYTVGALDYLVKPVKEDKLSAVLKRAQEKLEADKPKAFSFRSTEGIFRLPLREILYCYSDRRQVVAVTALREYPFYAKLDDVAQQLGGGFIRIHQRYLVSAQAVTAVLGDSVRVGAVELPISRGLKNQAMLALTRSLID